jgi:hypothetical protein
MLALSLGCQTYDFEPVQPLAVGQTTQKSHLVAKALKPNVMILVDKSGSMSQQITATTTRISELQSAMNAFLGSSGNIARFGLATFPTDNSCGATSSLQVDLPAPSATDDSAADAANSANANQINSKIQAIVPSGGTPTNASLAYLGGLAQLNQDDDRPDFVLVLTDGVPNCNPTNANTCHDQTACRCTTASTCSGPTCVIGCLDRAGVVGQVQALRGKDIKTIVVGFGTDTSSGDGPDVLNAMAEAGGFARTCPNNTDAECGSNNTCMQGVCQKQFYQATNAAELSAALASIGGNLIPGDACAYPLASAPSDPSLLAVIVNGVHYASGPDTWSYSAQRIEFLGALCDKLKAAMKNNPFNVEVREVDSL